MLDMITMQPQLGGFMIQVGESHFIDEPVATAIEAVAVQPHETEEEDDSVSEENFFDALEQVHRTLEEIKTQDLQEHQEIVQLLSGRLPICSVQNMALLLGHIYQAIVMTEAFSNESDFVRSLEVVLEGFAEMEKDESLIPSELISLFKKEAVPSLLRAITILLDPSASKEVNKSPSIPMLKLQKTLIHEAFSDCATTVALTDASSGVPDLRLYSPQSPEATTGHIQDSHTPTMFDLQEIVASGVALDLETNLKIQVAHDIYKTSSADSRVLQLATDSTVSEKQSRKLDPLAFRYVAEREGLLIPLLSNKKMESTSKAESDLINFQTTNQYPQPTTLPLGKHACTSMNPTEGDLIASNKHYDEALNNIKMIRLRLQDTKEEDTTVIDEAMPLSVECDDSSTISMKTQTGQYILEQSSMTLVKTSRMEVKDDSNAAESHCDSTVECSLDSVNITDDEASQTSEESVGSGFFNCAMDMVLDTVLGSCWEEDSGLSSEGSCCVSCDHSQSSDGDFSSSLSLTEIDDCEPELTNKKRQQILPKVVMIDTDHELRAVRARSPIMESDPECIESEDNSTKSDWWVHDISGNAVETESLTSF